MQRLKVLTVIRVADTEVTGELIAHSDRLSKALAAIENSVYRRLPIGKVLIVKQNATNKAITVLLADDTGLTGGLIITDSSLSNVFALIRDNLYLGLQQ